MRTDLHLAAENRLALDGHRTVYRWVGRSGGVELQMTGGDLRRRAGPLARRFRKARPAGGIVGLAAPSGPDFLIAPPGCIFAGMTALPLPSPGPGPAGHRLEAGVATIGSGLFFCMAEHAKALRSLAPEAEILLPDDGVSEPPRFACPDVSSLLLPRGLG